MSDVRERSAGRAALCVDGLAALELNVTEVPFRIPAMDALAARFPTAECKEKRATGAARE